jgi:hypothetical protein
MKDPFYESMHGVSSEYPSPARLFIIFNDIALQEGVIEALSSKTSTIFSLINV